MLFGAATSGSPAVFISSPDASNRISLPPVGQDMGDVGPGNEGDHERDQEAEEFNPEDDIEEVEDFDEANLENDIEEVEEEEELEDLIVQDEDDDEDKENRYAEPTLAAAILPSVSRRFPLAPFRSQIANSAQVRPRRRVRDRDVRMREANIMVSEGEESSSDGDGENESSESQHSDEDEDNDEEEEEDAEEGFLDVEYQPIPLEEVAHGMTVINMSRKKTTEEDENVIIDVCGSDNDEAVVSSTSETGGPSTERPVANKAKDAKKDKKDDAAKKDEKPKDVKQKEEPKQKEETKQKEDAKSKTDLKKKEDKQTKDCEYDTIVLDDDDEEDYDDDEDDDDEDDDDDDDDDEDEDDEDNNNEDQKDKAEAETSGAKAKGDGKKTEPATSPQVGDKVRWKDVKILRAYTRQIYRLDVNSMTEEKTKVAKERERRQEIQYFYRALQEKLSKPRAAAAAAAAKTGKAVAGGPPRATRLWPKQVILKRATDSIVELKKADCKLELELESEMQRNFILKKKLRDRSVLDSLQLPQPGNVAATGKSADKKVAPDTTGPSSNPANPPPQPPPPKRQPDPKRPLFIVRKLAVVMPQQQPKEDEKRRQEDSDEETTDSDEEEEEEEDDEEDEEEEEEEDDDDDVILCEDEETPQKDEKLEGNSNEKFGAKIENKLEHVTNAIISAIKLKVEDKGDKGPLSGPSSEGCSAGRPADKAKEAEILAAIKKLKTTIRNTVVAVPSKFKEEEELPAKRRTRSRASIESSASEKDDSVVTSTNDVEVEIVKASEAMMSANLARLKKPSRSPKSSPQ